MREKLTLAQVKAILEQAAKASVDPGVFEMLPAETTNYIQSAAEILNHLHLLENQILKKESDFAELNMGLVEYANQSGQGQMMLDNLKLCIDQIRYRKT